MPNCRNNFATFAAVHVAHAGIVVDTEDMPDAGETESLSRGLAVPRVVFVAFSCEPGRGSEPGVGWNFVHEMSNVQPVWVVTHDSHREPIEAYLRGAPTTHPIHFSFVRLPGLDWLRRGGYLCFNIYYYLWQFAAARALRRLHARHRFDIVQHISLMRWWMMTAASTLARRGVKFVWGPIGAGELMDRRFTHSIGWRNRLLESVRGVARWLCRHDPCFTRTVRAADVALASTHESAARLRELGVRRVEMMSGIAIQIPQELQLARRNRRPGVFRFISGGGLIYWKRFDIALRAFAAARLPDAEYVHVCGGYEQAKLEQLARDLGVADRVKFLGEMPYSQCVAELAKADAMIHPVLRDSAGIVVEAMTLGLPVLTIDHLSPGFLVPDDGGHKVPLHPGVTIDELVDSFAQVMRQWYENPELVARLSAAAARRGEQLSRAARNRQLAEIHNRVAPKSTARPLSMPLAASKTARVA